MRRKRERDHGRYAESGAGSSTSNRSCVPDRRRERTSRPAPGHHERERPAVARCDRRDRARFARAVAKRRDDVTVADDPLNLDPAADRGGARTDAGLSSDSAGQRRVRGWRDVHDKRRERRSSRGPDRAAGPGDASPDAQRGGRHARATAPAWKHASRMPANTATATTGAATAPPRRRASPPARTKPAAAASSSFRHLSRRTVGPPPSRACTAVTEISPRSTARRSPRRRRRQALTPTRGACAAGTPAARRQSPARRPPGRRCADRPRRKRTARHPPVRGKQKQRECRGCRSQRRARDRRRAQRAMRPVDAPEDRHAVTCTAPRRTMSSPTSSAMSAAAISHAASGGSYRSPPASSSTGRRRHPAARPGHFRDATSRRPTRAPRPRHWLRIGTSPTGRARRRMNADSTDILALSPAGGTPTPTTRMQPLPIDDSTAAGVPSAHRATAVPVAGTRMRTNGATIVAVPCPRSPVATGVSTWRRAANTPPQPRRVPPRNPRHWALRATPARRVRRCGRRPARLPRQPPA